MSPIHASKQGMRYRHYVTCALAQGQPEEAGSVARVAAAAVEQPVLQTLRKHHPDLDAATDPELIERCAERVVVHPTAIEITLRADSDTAEEHSTLATNEGSKPAASTVDRGIVLHIPWLGAATKRRREIIAPAQPEPMDHRPIRAETRATLVRGITLGRRWLDELVTHVMTGSEAIASREGRSRRHVNMTISLAFLAPDLVRAAVEGRLPKASAWPGWPIRQSSGHASGNGSACSLSRPVPPPTRHSRSVGLGGSALPRPLPITCSGLELGPAERANRSPPAAPIQPRETQ